MERIVHRHPDGGSPVEAGQRRCHRVSIRHAAPRTPHFQDAPVEGVGELDARPVLGRVDDQAPAVEGLDEGRVVQRTGGGSPLRTFTEAFGRRRGPNKRW
ncbi:hypothetical protein [Streptomyces sp. Isolate_45]|uniref:hypothetical protein n=1 Tax=Streptomyces sp. Isolate_45 TaxID=2950111 RepID=UPI002481D705|nr:hypothetical protein [Streptomyces sp. Isolate_45]MDA5279256.1 hypothetical protein [Streptomyces sp. Isolate_45]